MVVSILKEFESPSSNKLLRAGSIVVFEDGDYLEFLLRHNFVREFPENGFTKGTPFNCMMRTPKGKGYE